MGTIQVSAPLPSEALRALTEVAAIGLMEAYRDSALGLVRGQEAIDELQRDIDALRCASDWLKLVNKQASREALGALTDEYRGFCWGIGFDLGSADEHFNDPRLNPEQKLWLRDFAKRWDAAACPLGKYA